MISLPYAIRRQCAKDNVLVRIPRTNLAQASGVRTTITPFATPVPKLIWIPSG
jgi:hypothetical protein